MCFLEVGPFSYNHDMEISVQLCSLCYVLLQQAHRVHLLWHFLQLYVYYLMSDTK